MSEDVSLEKCPHCGTDKIIIACHETYELHGAERVTRVEYAAKCAQCGAIGPRSLIRSDEAMDALGAIDAVVRMWNKRTQ